MCALQEVFYRNQLTIAFDGPESTASKVIGSHMPRSVVEGWAFRPWSVYQLARCCMTEPDRVDHQWRLVNNRGHDDDPR